MLTPEELAKLGDMSMLVIGDSGTGKTRFIETLPDPFIFDFDKGTASIRTDIPYATFKDAPRGRVAMKGRGIYDYGTAWTQFVLKMNEIGKQIDEGTCPYRTLCFDSLTLMSDICMNNILKNDPKVSGDTPGINHWGAQIRALSQMLDQITSWPGIKYVTAHIQRNTNDLTNVTELLPLVTGKLAGKCSIYFDEVYFALVEGTSKTGYKHIFQTHSDSIKKQARSRWNVPDGIEQNFDVVARAIIKARKL